MAPAQPKISWFVGLYAITGLVFIGVGIPLSPRHVPPNATYGLRVPATFANERVWYDANAASGRDLAIVGAVVLLAAGVLPFIKHISAIPYALICSGLLVGSLIIVAIVGIWRASRMLREHGGAGSSPRPTVPATRGPSSLRSSG